MGIKRIVDTNFWSDDKVVEYFRPEDKLFMLYLMTNPHTTQLGIYSINKKLMAFETGYSIDVINKLLKRFENDFKMIKYSENSKEVAIRNYLKYSIIKGGKPVEDLLYKEIKQVKDKSLLRYICLNIKDCKSLNETVKKVINTLNYNDNDKHNDNDNDNDNENEKSYPLSLHDTLYDTSEKVIQHLNFLAGTNFKSTSKTTQKLIKSLLEDYTVDDIILVIDKMCYLWNKEPKKGEKDMRVYLRPSTLFRKSNFENYLGMNVPQKKITTGDLAKKIDFSEFM